MSGIIGYFYTILGFSTIGKDSHLFHAYVIKARLVLYHLIPVDFVKTQVVDNK